MPAKSPWELEALLSATLARREDPHARPIGERSRELLEEYEAAWEIDDSAALTELVGSDPFEEPAQ